MPCIPKKKKRSPSRVSKSIIINVHQDTETEPIEFDISTTDLCSEDSSTVSTSISVIHEKSDKTENQTTKAIIELVTKSKREDIRSPSLRRRTIRGSLKRKQKKIKVKLVFTLNTISPINNYSQTAKVNFELGILYKKWDFIRYKFVPVQDNTRCFPFIINNACGDMEIVRKTTGELFNSNINNCELYGNSHIAKKDTQARDIILYEIYSIICEVKLINRLNLIPFNVVYVPINIGTNGSPRTEQIHFIHSRQSSFYSIMDKYDATFFSIPKWERFSKTPYARMTRVTNNMKSKLPICINSSKKGVKNKCLYKNFQIYWPRAYYVVKFTFSATEDIIKYFIIPTMFNNMLILFSTLEKNDFLSLFTTFCLTDIALLFTMPETKCLTISETSIISDVLISIFLACNRWFYNDSINSYWHLLPSISKGLLLLGGKIWSCCQIKKENQYLKKWFIN